MVVKICLCTVPDAETGRRLAALWLEKRWAACVNRVPGIISHYVWDGEIREDGEELLIVKTTEAGAGAIRAALSDDHPYDCPEWIELSPEGGLDDYLGWIRDAVSPGSS